MVAGLRTPHLPLPSLGPPQCGCYLVAASGGLGTVTSPHTRTHTILCRVEVWHPQAYGGKSRATSYSIKRTPRKRTVASAAGFADHTGLGSWLR